MINFISISGKSPSAITAVIWFFSVVCSHMMSQACSLGKLFCAILECANIRLDTQMNIPVARVWRLRFKRFSAAIVEAYHYFILVFSNSLEFHEADCILKFQVQNFLNTKWVSSILWPCGLTQLWLMYFRACCQVL